MTGTFYRLVCKNNKNREIPVFILFKFVIDFYESLM